MTEEHIPEKELAAKNLPSRDVCLEMIQDPERELPEGRKRHILRTNEASMGLSRKLAETGAEIDLDIVDRASLLHDIAKVTDDAEHERKAAEIIRQKGWSEKLAQVVELHRSAAVAEASSHSWEAKVLSYVDRRTTKEGEPTTLDEWRQIKGFPETHELYTQYQALEEEIRERLRGIDVDLEELFA